MKEMNRNEHALLGAIVGFGGYLLYKWVKKENPNLIELILSACGGAFMGILPDLLEPALNPNHRSIFHSLAVLGLIGYGNYKIWENPDLSEKQKLALFLLSSTFSSHLLADSQTAKGLPLLF